VLVGIYFPRLPIDLIDFVLRHVSAAIAVASIALFIFCLLTVGGVIRNWLWPFFTDLPERRRIQLAEPLARLEIESVLGRLRLVSSRLWYLQRVYESGIKPEGMWSAGYPPSFGRDKSGTFLAQLEARWLGIER
jgi:hypothetical protein